MSGANHTCVLLRDSSVWCSGSNAYCQLGPETAKGVARRGVVYVGSGVARLTAMRTMTCGVDRGGRGRCWGALHRNMATCADRVYDVADARGGLHAVADGVIVAVRAVSLSGNTVTVAGARYLPHGARMAVPAQRCHVTGTQGIVVCDGAALHYDMQVRRSLWLQWLTVQHRKWKTRASGCAERHGHVGHH